MNCLFLLVLLSCCGGFGGGRSTGHSGEGCGCSNDRRGEREDCGCGSDQRSGRESSGCGNETRGGQESCGCGNDRRSGQESCGCGNETRGGQEDCGCGNDRRGEREGCGCDRHYQDSRPMPRYDDSMRGCSFGDAVPEMRMQSRGVPNGYPENETYS